MGTGSLVDILTGRTIVASKNMKSLMGVAVGSVGMAAADGPLPFGDIAALGALGAAAWNAYKTVQLPGGGTIESPAEVGKVDLSERMPIKDLSGVTGLITDPIANAKALGSMVGGKSYQKDTRTELPGQTVDKDPVIRSEGKGEIDTQKLLSKDVGEKDIDIKRAFLPGNSVALVNELSIQNWINGGKLEINVNAEQGWEELDAKNKEFYIKHEIGHAIYRTLPKEIQDKFGVEEFASGYAMNTLKKQLKKGSKHSKFAEKANEVNEWIKSQQGKRM